MGYQYITDVIVFLNKSIERCDFLGKIIALPKRVSKTQLTSLESYVVKQTK